MTVTLPDTIVKFYSNPADETQNGFYIYNFNKV